MSTATDLRHQAPIPKAQLAKVTRPEKISQTALSHFDSCARAGFLYYKHRGGPQSAAMARGEIFHQFVEQSVEHMRDESKPQLELDEAKDRIMALIRKRTDLHLPEYEQNVCRLMAWNWAMATAIDPECIVGLEQMIELEIGEFTVRGKLDFAEITPVRTLIRDYKTSIALPSQDEIENGAKSFQGRFYALLLMFGIPEGESLPLGKGLDELDVELAYPRYLNTDTGELVGRTVTWARDQIVDFGKTVRVHLEKIAHGFETGEFPAQAGSHCSICPARVECPLPESAHEIEQIDTVEEAEKALELHLTRDAAQRRLMKSVSVFHENYAQPIYVGDYSFDRRLQESRRVNWDEVGDGPVQPDQVKTVPSTPFRKRKITAAEREELDA